jgi:hypothetical protein
MPTVKVAAGRTRPDPIERLRSARMIPPPKPKPGPKSSARPTAPPRGESAGRLSMPGPARLPELHALDLVEQRRAAQAAVAATVAATPTVPPAAAEPEPEVLSVRGLLGW